MHFPSCRKGVRYLRSGGRNDGMGWIKPLIIFDAKSDADFHGDWCFSMKPLRVWMFCILVWCGASDILTHTISYPYASFAPGCQKWIGIVAISQTLNMRFRFRSGPNGKSQNSPIARMRAWIVTIFLQISGHFFLVRLYIFHRISKKWIFNEFLGFWDATFSDVRFLHCQVHGNGGDFLQCRDLNHFSGRSDVSRPVFGVWGLPWRPTECDWMMMTCFGDPLGSCESWQVDGASWAWRLGVAFCSWNSNCREPAIGSFLSHCLLEKVWSQPLRRFFRDTTAGDKMLQT